jgi:hypothetical protein
MKVDALQSLVSFAVSFNIYARGKRVQDVDITRR